MATSRRPKGLDRRAELRRFVQDHPHGWGHDEWRALLRRLEERGYRVADPEEIGAELEAERLRQVLQRLEVTGLGSQRREALVRRFRTLWSLRQAGAEEIARTPGIPRPVAQHVHDRLS